MFLYWDLKVLAQNLYLDSSVEASGQCTGERANGLDGTATTADYELSAQSFLLEAGKTEATVTVTPKQAYKEAKTLAFSLAAG